MVQKILDQLVTGGTLISKEYGKSVAYFCNQERIEAQVGDITQQRVSC